MPLMAAQSTIGLASGRDRLRTFYGGATDMVGVQTFGTMVPSPERGISIVGGNNEASTASPLRIDIVFDEAVVRNIEESRSRLRDAFAAIGIRAVLGPFHDLVPGSSLHVAGTAREHRKREYGAVDEWNRLFNAPNVIVADSALLCDRGGKEPGPDRDGDFGPCRRALCGELDVLMAGQLGLVGESDLSTRRSQRCDAAGGI